jgi:CRP-like cAMP-binding protein
MTLPIAVVDRWPMDEYKIMYTDQCEALKHSVTDTLKLYHEIQLLHQLFRSQSDKESKRIDKSLDLLIREKEERYFRLTKFSDYCAMVMAAYPESRFMTGHDYKRAKDNITDPILVRGISAGNYIKHAADNNRDFYFIETGYLGNYRSENNLTGRKVYHRIEKNAMQQRRFLDVPDDRWKALCQFSPALTYHGWRKNPGSKILLIMSTEKPFEFYGENKDTWVDQTIKKIQQHTDRPIVIKDKPGRAQRNSTDNIYDALNDDVWAVVTYNSIAAVEAIQSGIPAFALAPTAAAPVASADLTQIENPIKPDEDIIMKWLASVAYGQFSIDEIITGQAWNMVQENEQRPTFTY